MRESLPVSRNDISALIQPDEKICFFDVNVIATEFYGILMVLISNFVVFCSFLSVNSR